jgi:hypothetical protein
MPLPLPNLYAAPGDIFDALGAEGVDLLLDDRNDATGQKVQASQNAAIGATSLPITALTFPLLAGSTLQFAGSGMDQLAVTLSAVAKKGDTSLTVNPLSAAVNALASALDNGANVAAARRLVKACQYGTSQVKLYCCTRYDDSQLVLAWSCNRWATALGARWLCRRRRQTAPKGIEADADAALQEMLMVKSGALSIEDIGTRTSGWPYMSNVSVDVRYELGRVRVIPLLSEGTPTQYAQMVDWNSVFYTGFSW